MVGCLTPPAMGDADLGTLQRVILAPSGSVIFWNGVITPKPEELARNYEILGRSAEQWFPIQFISEMEIAAVLYQVR